MASSSTVGAPEHIRIAPENRRTLRCIERSWLLLFPARFTWSRKKGPQNEGPRDAQEAWPHILGHADSGAQAADKPHRSPTWRIVSPGSAERSVALALSLSGSTYPIHLPQAVDEIVQMPLTVVFMTARRIAPPSSSDSSPSVFTI